MENFNSVVKERPIVKICGLQTVEAAQTALDSGADLIGIICVPNRKRTVKPEVAKSISNLIHSQTKYAERGLVGVFRNQPVEEVNRLVLEYNVDIVQLHGEEPIEDYISVIKKPIIKRFIFPRDCEEVLKVSKQENITCLPLFDSEAGGTGEILDWKSISDWAEIQLAQDKKLHFILAGGLTPDNVNTAIKMSGVCGVDVSGGVETNGVKDLEKIKSFVMNGKRI